MVQDKALLVLDAQVNMFDDGFHVYDGVRILQVIRSSVGLVYIKIDEQP
jgi:hypothetical protein